MLLKTFGTKFIDHIVKNINSRVVNEEHCMCLLQPK